MTHRVIQIYRGTTAQNDAFTGSAGELTMDTTTNELRVHDGSTAGGHKIGAGYHPDLFDHKWADHILNDVSWLRGDTFSWQSGAVYQAAYQHLLDDLSGKISFGWDSEGYTKWTASRHPQVGDPVYNGQTLSSQVGTVEAYDSATDTITISGYAYPFITTGAIVSPSTETIGTITISYYEATDGHKICLANQESVVAQIYAATGVAWYYILDTDNQRFKLPRVSPDKANVFDTAPVSVGVYGDGNKLMLRRTSDGATGGLVCYAAGNPNNSLFSNEFSAYNGTVGISTDPTNSGLVGSGTMTTNGATTHYSGKKYLYFYVGNFTQTALENTAGLNASLFNAKADIDLSNTTAENDFVIDRQEPTAQNNYTWYRKYRSGWVEQGGIHTFSTSSPHTVNLPITMADTKYLVLLTVGFPNSGDSTCSILARTDLLTTTTISIQKQWTSTNGCYYWQVSGKAA